MVPGRRFSRLLGGAAWTLPAALLGCSSSPPDDPAVVSAPEWSAQLGGEGLQVPRAVASAGDALVVAGVYEAQFSVGDQLLSGSGGLEGVVAAFDSSGGLRWLQQLAGAAGDDLIAAMAATPSAEVFVGGQASSGATFGGRSLTVDGIAAALLGKLRQDGEIEWIVSGRGAGVQRTTAVATAADGAVYFAGDFSHELDLGAEALTSNGEGDAFLARYTAAGELEWVKSIAGDGAQHVANLAVSPDGGVVLIGHYGEQLAVEASVVSDNPLCSTTPFVARYEPDGSLGWLQTELLPLEINHIGQEHAEHPAHWPVVVQDLSISVAPSGAVTAGLTYGNTFGMSEGDFEAPRVVNLIVTQMAPDGSVALQSTLTTPEALLFLGQIIAHDDRAELAFSWTGRLPAFGGGEVVDSDGHRSLALVDFMPDGSFSPRLTFSVPAVGLTSQAALRDRDGSLLVAASWRDMSTLDQDVFLARFR